MSNFKKMVMPVNAQYLKVAEAMREHASEVAMTIAQASHCHPGIPDALDAHVSLMLQAIAAEHMAYGREVLAKHYLASALRVEVTALESTVAALAGNKAKAPKK
jgi:hypothetical protein